MSYTLTQKYDLSKLKPILENDRYALYGFGYITETVRKGIRVNKQTKEQVDVIIETKPNIRVISIIRDGVVQKLR